MGRNDMGRNDELRTKESEERSVVIRQDETKCRQIRLEETRMLKGSLV